MKLEEFKEGVANQYGLSAQWVRGEILISRVTEWLAEGLAVSAVYIGDKLITAHYDDGAARNSARLIVADGPNDKSAVRIKRIVL